MKSEAGKIAVVLGGGGARGFAHIGALKVLREKGVDIGLVVGTSMGALIGGAYACGIEPAQLERMVLAYESSKEFRSSPLGKMERNRPQGGTGLVSKLLRAVNAFNEALYMAQAMFKPGILSHKDVESIVNYFLPDINIENTRIPFRAVTTDLVSGQQIVISQGSIRQAVLASSAVPGAVEPLRDGERLLADGGIVSLVPVGVARTEGADVVIAVVVDKELKGEGLAISTATDVYGRAADIMCHCLSDFELREADAVIRPNVGNSQWSAFSQAAYFIREGERAARACWPDVQKALCRAHRQSALLCFLIGLKDRIFSFGRTG
ncbi:MAG: patatin-like phospholipase family protein [Smithellaceae bacterium]|nr:patatin-like phospholipase family protein [Smithellaceae bacterium]